MNEMTLWKIVVGASMPRPSGFSGMSGCSARTTNPKTKSTVLKTSSATVYCFQFCGPVSRRRSNQRSTRGAR